MHEGPEGFWDQWEAGEWRPYAHDALIHLLTPESTFVDIGAWIGPTALWAAPLCWRVIALEPDPVAFGMLRRNVFPFTNVLARQAALAPESGTASLYHRGAFGESMSSLVPTGEDAVTVDTMSPAELFARYHIEAPAVVNLHVEGSESLVLPLLAPMLVASQTPLMLSVHEPWSGPDGPTLIAEALGLFGNVETLHVDGPGFYHVLATA